MLSIKARGIPEMQRWLQKIVRGRKIAAVRAFMQYLIGDQTHGLKHYPVYKYVTRQEAYGKPFQSERQRRWFFANLREGRIDPGYPHRTGNLQRAWDYRERDSDWRTAEIYNDVPYGGYVMGNSGQARLNALVGWRRVLEVIRDNFRGAIRAAQAAANRVK